MYSTKSDIWATHVPLNLFKLQIHVKDLIKINFIYWLPSEPTHRLLTSSNYTCVILFAREDISLWKLERLSAKLLKSYWKSLVSLIGSFKNRDFFYHCWRYEIDSKNIFIKMHFEKFLWKKIYRWFWKNKFGYNWPKLYRIFFTCVL